MIILDTNVLSELMKLAPDEDVARWMTSKPPSSVYLTSISQAEILYGIAVLPAGRRRNALEAAAAQFPSSMRKSRRSPSQAAPRLQPATSRTTTAAESS